MGLTSDDAYDICFAAGCDPRVRLADFSEFNPHVEGYVTGKLVANLFYQLCCGRSQLLAKAGQSYRHKDILAIFWRGTGSPAT